MQVTIYILEKSISERPTFTRDYVFTCTLALILPSETILLLNFTDGSGHRVLADHL